MTLDRKMAKICLWLKSHGYTAHVDLKGRVDLKDKETGNFVKTV